MGQHIIATRKDMEVYHILKYRFEKISSRQFRIIDNHFRNMDGGVTSFYVVDWSDPRVIKAISGDKVTLNNVHGFSSNTGDGGNRVILWSNDGDYGNDSTISSNVLTDLSKSWTVNEWADFKLMDSIGTERTASQNTGNTIMVMSGSLINPGAYDIYQYYNRYVSSLDVSGRNIHLNASPELTFSEYKQFALPVYECFYMEDTLSLEPEEFNLESNDNYGPLYAGEINFMQKGTGT